MNQTTESLVPRPLAGVKVLDLSRVLAGPWAGQLLADYGADVIKVERPGTGDDTRSWGPPFFEDDTRGAAAYFLCANRGKRSIAVDLTTPDGQAVVRHLAQHADVLIENYKVGQLAKYGLDAPSLRALNPRLVYCSITGYGQDGPQAHDAGYDFAVQAAGGLMSLTGPPEDAPGSEPQKVGVAVADLFTGLYAVTAVLAALHEAARTGQGRHIDAALLDTQIAMMSNQASQYLVSGRPAQRLGNAHPNIVPYQVFATQDGHMVVAVGNDGQFARFCEQLGRPELAQDPRYATNPERVRHRDTLSPLLQERMLMRSTAEWVAAFEPHAVPCAPILKLDAVFEQPQVLARGMRMQMGTMPLVANPMRMDGLRPHGELPPPTLDEHGPAIRSALSRDQGWPAT